MAWLDIDGMQPIALPAQYCEAYRAQALAGHSGWTTRVTADAAVYLHDDRAVGTHVARLCIVFDDQDTAWRTFAANKLDLRSTVSTTGAAHRLSITGSATIVNRK